MCSNFRGDDVTLCCLRLTSRTFLRILHCQSDIWTVNVPAGPGQGLHRKLRRLFRRDGRCENCSRWNVAHLGPSRPYCLLESCRREMIEHKYGRFHCSACNIDHDACHFPLYQGLGQRRCLGWQGSVQLCEHVRIPWGTIKAHLDDWRRRQQQCGGGGGPRGGGPGAKDNWQECLDRTVFECHDLIHDTRCTALDAPTWPRARLGTTSGPERDTDVVVLFLEWTPHARVEALMPRADGRIPAPELRALFRKFRRHGPADILYPPGRPGTLPEMACFTPSFPIHYKMEEQQESDESAENKSPTSDHSWKFSLPSSYRSLISRTYIGKNSQKLEIRPQNLSCTKYTGLNSKCLMVDYQKAIVVCQTRALTDPGVKLVPSKNWLYAVDPRTYPYERAPLFRQQCRDESCTNYYPQAKE